MATRFWRPGSVKSKGWLVANVFNSLLHDVLHDPHDPLVVLPAMDADLIKLVNKLQDTFANLGQSQRDMMPIPQLAVVRVFAQRLHHGGCAEEAF